MPLDKGCCGGVIDGAGKRFAHYVVDGEFSTAPFLHTAGDLELRVVARLKDNLPELFAAVQKRFACLPPTLVFQQGQDRIEIWDAEDFDPWHTLRWETVRVLRYRQHKPDGQVVEATWFTDFASSRVGPRVLFRATNRSSVACVPYQEFLAYGDEMTRVKFGLASPRARCESLRRALPLSTTGYVRLATGVKPQSVPSRWPATRNWHRVASDRPGESVAETLHKGDHVLVDGQLASSNYERENGKSRKAKAAK